MEHEIDTYIQGYAVLRPIFADVARGEFLFGSCSGGRVLTVVCCLKALGH